MSPLCPLECYGVVIEKAEHFQLHTFGSSQHFIGNVAGPTDSRTLWGNTMTQFPEGVSISITRYLEQVSADC